MSERQMVRVAAVQAAPVFLDREATVDKAIGLFEKAVADGAQLVVFPETFIPTYPEWVWRTKPWDDDASALYARLLDQSVVIGSPTTDALADAARRLGAHLSIGVNERGGDTLYNTQLLFDDHGELVINHRKLMPTGGERLVWGFGDGSTLTVVPTALGRIGGLTCWENYMPLARAAIYAQGVDIYLAPTWDNGACWVPTMQHIAKEGRCHVIGVNSCIRGSDVGAEVPRRAEVYGEADDDFLSRGNTVICGPNGDILAGPLVGEAGIITAELDLDAAREARMYFDAVGHYSRPDVLELVVHRGEQRPVRFESGE
jgi:nitrilase